MPAIKTCATTGECGSGGTPLLGFTYTYDDVGNVTQIADSRGDSWRQAFGYDVLDRLAGVTVFTATPQYPAPCFLYDPRGNRTNCGLTTYGYDAHDRLTSQSSFEFTYDVNGNLVESKDTSFSPAAIQTYTYTPENLMATTTTPAGATTMYTYDADGWRALTTTVSSATHAVRGPNGQLLTDWTVTGTSATARDHVYAGARLIGFIKTTGTVSVPSTPPSCSGTTFTDDPLVPGTSVVKATHVTELRAAIDAARIAQGLSAYGWTAGITAGVTVIEASQISEMRTALQAAYAAAGQSLTWFTDPTLAAGIPIKAAHFRELRAAVCGYAAPLTVWGQSTEVVFDITTDPIGSIRMVKQAGVAPERHDFAPFGEEVGPSQTSVLAERFAGKERDAETGFDYFGARYHRALSGRFSSPDPLRNSGKPWQPQSWNRYTYVDNNPLRYMDPTGLYKWAVGCDEASDDACKADRDRFREAYANLKAAALTLEEGSKERKTLESVIRRIGEEGKGNVTIRFGDAGTTDGRPNYGITWGNRITLNFRAVDQTARDFQLSPGEARAFDSGLVAHEGEHAGAGIFPFSFLTMSLRQSTAYRTESYTYQGLHNTDKVFQLWNETWSGLDKVTIGQFRERAIQSRGKQQ